MCLVQGHNTVTPVRLEPATPRSRLKQDFTESLRFKGSGWMDGGGGGGVCVGGGEGVGCGCLVFPYH